MWDEAEAILRASEDLGAVMEVIREAESPVEARRALKSGFGFTGRQAALLLTLPVMSFTRSERRRLDEGRRARADLLADVTGAVPAVPASASESRSEPGGHEPGGHEPGGNESGRHRESGASAEPSAPAGPRWDAGSSTDWDTDFGAAFDGVLAGISSAMQEQEVTAPPLLAAPPAPEPPPSSSSPASSAAASVCVP